MITESYWQSIRTNELKETLNKIHYFISMFIKIFSKNYSTCNYQQSKHNNQFNFEIF